jgi:hypothetical protein
MVTVMDPSGAVIVGAQLKISPSPDPPLKNPKTNEEGRFFVRLLPGGYDLYVSYPNFDPWSKHVEVADTGNHAVEVYMQVAESAHFAYIEGHGFLVQPVYKDPGSATINVSVTDWYGYPVPYARIRCGLMSPLGEKILEADEHGKISLRGIPPSFGLEVTSPGFHRSKMRIDIRNGESQTVGVFLDALPKPKP